MYQDRYEYKLNNSREYYYNRERKAILEFKTDAFCHEPPFGHFFHYDRNGKDRDKHEDAIANAIFERMTKEQQTEAYAAFIRYAFRYDGYVDIKGSAIHDGYFYPSLYKFYRLRSLYSEDVVLIPTSILLTRIIDKDADKIADDAEILDQIKSKFPPRYLFSDVGYWECGQFQRKENMLEKYIISTDPEGVRQCAVKDEYYGFISLQEIKEKYGNTRPDSLANAQKRLNISKQYFIGIETDTIWRMVTYSLKRVPVNSIIEVGCILPPEDLPFGNEGILLGRYSSIEECIEKNQEKLGIQLRPVPSVLNRVILLDEEAEENPSRGSRGREPYRKPDTTTPCDAVSRQAAIDVCEKYSGYMPGDIAQKMWEELKHLTPAQPWYGIEDKELEEFCARFKEVCEKCPYCEACNAYSASHSKLPYLNISSKK